MWLYVMGAGLMLGMAVSAWYPELALILMLIAGAIILACAYAWEDLQALGRDTKDFANDLMDAFRDDSKF